MIYLNILLVTIPLKDLFKDSNSKSNYQSTGFEVHMGHIAYQW